MLKLKKLEHISADIAEYERIENAVKNKNGLTTENLLKRLEELKWIIQKKAIGYSEIIKNNEKEIMLNEAAIKILKEEIAAIEKRNKNFSDEIKKREEEILSGMDCIKIDIIKHHKWDIKRKKPTFSVDSEFTSNDKELSQYYHYKEISDVEIIKGKVYKKEQVLDKNQLKEAYKDKIAAFIKENPTSCYVSGEDIGIEGDVRFNVTRSVNLSTAKR